jgi:osmoprotectant transport system substrate-binding protein
MGRTKIISGIVLCLALSGCTRSASRLTVGSKNFTEQVLLGEIIAQHLENRLHREVDRKLNLGGTLLAHQALVSGEIDLYPEYTGTALAAVLKQPTVSDPAAVLSQVRSAYRDEFQVEWLDPLGIDNTFAMVVRGADARERHLETLSDAAKVKTGWVLGVGYEFEQRSDGLPALERVYHIPFQGAPKVMDLGLLYRAMEQNQVTMLAANATDGQLSTMDLKVLEDDRHAFPPYQVCIAARLEALSRIDGLKAALLELSGKFDNARMQALNFEVDGRHRPLPEVAAEFLKKAGLR